jgi:hypothetical protein
MKMSNCQFCGEALSVTQRMTRKRLHPECKKKQDAFTDMYRKALDQSANALTFDANVKRTLDSIIKQGKYSDDQLHAINLDVYQGLKEKYLEDANLTEDKREFLRTIQGFFGLSDEEAETDELDRIRHLVWITEGNLPQIEAIVMLKKEEIAHFEGDVIWRHLKTRRRRVAGTRAQRVKIAKGVSFKVGGTPGHSEEYQEFQDVDQGKLIVTNERLLFFGGKKNLNIKLDKIMEVETYSDGVKIQGGTVNPTYFLMENSTLFSVILLTAKEIYT